MSNQDAWIATARRALVASAVRADLLGCWAANWTGLTAWRARQELEGWRPADRNLEEEA